MRDEGSDLPGLRATFERETRAPRPVLADALADRMNVAALLWACGSVGLFMEPLDGSSAFFDGRMLSFMALVLIWVPLFAVIFQAVGWRLVVPLTRSLRTWALPDAPRWTRAFETTVASLWPLSLPYWLVTAPCLRALDQLDTAER
ncbi:MAG: hypothetical protein GKS06_05460 [Acidobacteria bacterium]|nr:hypothetical protein [Acidobacteriota bacterium]